MSTISLKDVSLIVDGAPVQGLAPEGVTLAFTNEIFTHVPGVNSSTRLKNVDLSGTITINLLSTSSSNNTFKGIIDEDMETNNKRFGLQITDNISGEKYSAINAYFTKRADAAFSNDSNNRVYTILVPKLNHDGASGSTQ